MVKETATITHEWEPDGHYPHRLDYLNQEYDYTLHQSYDASTYEASPQDEQLAQHIVSGLQMLFSKDLDFSQWVSPQEIALTQSYLSDLQAGGIDATTLPSANDADPMVTAIAYIYVRQGIDQARVIMEAQRRAIEKANNPTTQLSEVNIPVMLAQDGSYFYDKVQPAIGLLGGRPFLPRSFREQALGEIIPERITFALGTSKFREGAILPEDKSRINAATSIAIDPRVNETWELNGRNFFVLHDRNIHVTNNFIVRAVDKYYAWASSPAHRFLATQLPSPANPIRRAA